MTSSAASPNATNRFRLYHLPFYYKQVAVGRFCFRTWLNGHVDVHELDDNRFNMLDNRSQINYNRLTSPSGLWSGLCYQRADTDCELIWMKSVYETANQSNHSGEGTTPSRATAWQPSNINSRSEVNKNNVSGNDWLHMCTDKGNKVFLHF